MKDELFDKAWEIILEEGIASTSLLTRKLKINYNRAVKIIDEMEALGYVGEFRGAKPREILKVV